MGSVSVPGHNTASVLVYFWLAEILLGTAEINGSKKESGEGSGTKSERVWRGWDEMRKGGEEAGVTTKE